MTLGILLLLAGLTISAVAIYYSVVGLAAIFAAATVPIYIMGGALELSKLIAASWLKENWDRISGFLKWYMVGSVVILMCITSLGIFGFLSKAHLDQTLVSGGNQVQLQELDRQIEIEKRTVADATLVIAQLDQAVQSLTNSQTINGRNGALAVRRAQVAERKALNETIKTANARISEIEAQRLPLLRDKMTMEAEIGPIKYIAQLVYGESVDSSILEKAVTLVIILLVVVFDPLAVAMLLSAQLTFKWHRNAKKETNAISHPTSSANQDVSGNVNRESSSDAVPAVEHDLVPVPVSETVANTSIENIKQEPKEFDITEHPYLFNGGFGFKNSTPVVAPTLNSVAEPEAVGEPSELPTDPQLPADTELNETGNTDPLLQDQVDNFEEKTVKLETDSKYQILPELIEESPKKKFMIKTQGQQQSRLTK